MLCPPFGLSEAQFSSQSFRPARRFFSRPPLFVPVIVQGGVWFPVEMLAPRSDFFFFFFLGFVLVVRVVGFFVGVVWVGCFVLGVCWGGFFFFLFVGCWVGLVPHPLSSSLPCGPPHTVPRSPPSIEMPSFFQARRLSVNGVTLFSTGVSDPFSPHSFPPTKCSLLSPIALRPRSQASLCFMRVPSGLMTLFFSSTCLPLFSLTPPWPTQAWIILGSLVLIAPLFGFSPPVYALNQTPGSGPPGSFPSPFPLTQRHFFPTLFHCPLF